jgi:hypothetical protein
MSPIVARFAIVATTKTACQPPVSRVPGNAGAAHGEHQTQHRKLHVTELIDADSVTLRAPVHLVS